MQRHTRAHVRHQRKRHANRRIKYAKQRWPTYTWYSWLKKEFVLFCWPLDRPYNTFANNEAYCRRHVDMEKQWYQEYSPDRYLSDRDAIKEQLDDMM